MSRCCSLCREQPAAEAAQSGPVHRVQPAGALQRIRYFGPVQQSQWGLPEAVGPNNQTGRKRPPTEGEELGGFLEVTWSNTVPRVSGFCMRNQAIHILSRSAL